MPSKNDETAKARNKVYYAARAELIENHQDEYRELLRKHADAAGVTLKIRKTEEEKAAEQFEKLLAEHPELRHRLTQADAVATGTPDASTDV